MAWCPALLEPTASGDIITCQATLGRLTLSVSFFYSFLLYYILFRILHKTSGSVVAERSRALNSNSGVSVQQSVGLSPSSDTHVLKTLNHCFILPMARKAVGVLRKLKKQVH